MAKITEEIEREKELQAGQHFAIISFSVMVFTPFLPFPSMLRSLRSTLGGLILKFFWSFIENQSEVDRFLFHFLRICKFIY
jgi:hypothetical protein